MYSFAAIAAVSIVAQADETAAASTHVVRAGDTLWSISQIHDVPVAQLKTINNLSSDRLAIGQALKLSGGAVETVKPATIQTSSSVVQTTTVNLNLRASKSTKANVLVTIPKGKAVIVLNTEGSWSRVKYGAKTGFVANTYLKKAASTSAPSQPATPVAPAKPALKEETISQSFVTTANLNVRQGPGIGYALVTNIPNGTSVNATKQSGTWVYVTYNGKSGYVSTGYLKQTTTAPSAPVTPNAGDGGAGNATVDYVVNTPSLNVRASAATSAAVIGSVTAGQTLRVVQTSNGWHQIYIGNTVGFVSASYVKSVSKGATTAPTWETGSYDAHTFFTASPAAIRAQANDSSAIVGTTLRGGFLNVVGETSSHYRVLENGTTGFVSKAFVTAINGKSAQATRLATIAVAKKYVGTPYVWASSSPANGGFDCSGLIYYVFNQSGVNIPRTNVANYWAGAYFGPQLSESFVPQAGDLIFFENTYTAGPSHMGIMVDADTFIHAGTHGLGYNALSKEPYWKSRVIGYKRP
ncbi:C40 family peptidase [Exiguobacterium sp. TNDT2]|uniref:C40 family peptidase n=1 Tax=Exiguobacterium sp. TNDT2 TaxID=2233531 RepID=UPI000DEED99A|nr:C40 family peptidase [Exiguobacterium sp. TNDT2]